MLSSIVEDEFQKVIEENFHLHDTLFVLVFLNILIHLDVDLILDFDSIRRRY
jgi:hypothetical protein